MAGASNYPNGFAQGVVIRGVPIDVPLPGKVFWVNSSSVLAEGGIGGSDGNDGSYKKPFSTVDKGITACKAGRNDVVYVMPGHAETVTATNINMDVSGATVICLGEGDLRPTFSFGAAAATITVSAANCSWVGGYFKATFLDVASAFTIGAGKAFTLKGGFFEDTSAVLNFSSIVTTGATDNDADDLTVDGNVWYQLNVTAPLAFVSILAAEQRPRVINNEMYAKATSGGEFITLAAKIVTAAKFSDNIQIIVGATGTTTGIFLTGSGSTSTGIVSGNYVASLDTTAELIATAGTGLTFVENYYTGTADASAKLWPVVDAA